MLHILMFGALWVVVIFSFRRNHEGKLNIRFVLSDGETKQFELTDLRLVINQNDSIDETQ